jgi:dihydropyrimidinase
MENVKEMQSALERGVGAFKFFMAYRGSEASPGMPAADDGVIFLGFEEIARLIKEGYKTCARVHAETVEILFRLEQRYKDKGILPKTYTELRPPFLEVEAIQKCILWGRETGCPIYIVHVSTEEGAGLIGDARAAGMDVTGETCPQYLVLNTDNTDLVLSKTNPPVRTAADNAALWRALSAGTITCVGTDHVATRRSEKTDFWTALGIPGAATWLPLMLTKGVIEKRLTIEQVVDSCCSQPAKKFGLAPRKGVIAVGSDADLVLVDTTSWRTVNIGDSLGRSDYSCYDGWELTGWPVLTMVRGNVVYEAGQVLGEPVGGFVPAAVR